MSPLTSITDWYYGVDAGTERAEERRARTLARILTRSQRPRTAEPVARVDRVVLGAGARSVIVNELCDWDAGEQLESRETGGYLIGRLQGTALVVTAAFGPGPRAVRGYGWMGFELSYGDRLASACGADEAVIGNWHSHPDDSGPGSKDLRHWAREARWFGKRVAIESLGAFYLGLVARRACGDWAYPRFSAYVSRGDESAVEPIEIEGERPATRDPAEPWRL